MPIETFIDSNGEAVKLNRRFHSEARMTYRTSNIESLFENDCELLQQFVDHHQTKQVPRIQELYDYSEGNNHTVLKDEFRRKETDMADSRAVHNFGKMISSFRRGYLVGIPVKVEYMDNLEESVTDQALEDIEKDNDFYDLNRSLVLDMSKVGRSFEIIYFNTKEELVVKRMDPRNCFVIYENTLDGASICGVHYYHSNPFNDEEMNIDVYGVEKVYRFVRDKEGISPIEPDEARNLKPEQEHGFGFPQITEHKNNSTGMGDYESELSLIDLYDAAQSDTANYMTDLADAILAIIGDVSFPEDVDTAEKRLEYMKMMRKARFFQLAPPKNEDGEEVGSTDIKYLYKQYDVSGTEAYKTRLEKNIHEYTSTPDMNDEKFSGNKSGESMKYKMFGLDQESVSTKALFEKGLRQRYRLIATIWPKIAEENGNAFSDFDISKLKITFTPHLPQSTTDIVDVANKLYGKISDETFLTILKSVTDVNASDELKRLEREEPQQPEPRLGRKVGGEDEEANSGDEEQPVLDGSQR